MNESQKETAATLLYGYNWAPEMIASHVNAPLDEVRAWMNELAVAEAARRHAAYLRALPADRKETIHVPLGFSKMATHMKQAS